MGIKEMKIASESPLCRNTHHVLDHPSPGIPETLDVAEDIEHRIFFGEVQVGIDADVGSRPTATIAVRITQEEIKQAAEKHHKIKI